MVKSVSSRIIVKEKSKKKVLVRKENPFPSADSKELAKVIIVETATINVGNYESTKYTFGLTLSTNVKKIEKLKGEMENYITKTINEKVKSIKDELE